MSKDTQTELTYRQMDLIPLFIIIRWQPNHSDGHAFAQQMTNTVSKPLEQINNAIDSALEHVPGVLQEQKKKEFPLDEVHDYTDNYQAHWDPFINQIEKDLQDIHPEATTIKYEYQDFNTDLNIKKLIIDIQKTIQNFGGKNYIVHGIGLAEGGNILSGALKNIINAGTDKGKKSFGFFAFVGCALKKKYVLNQIELTAVEHYQNYKNIFDLNSNIIQFAKSPDSLIKNIKQQNQTPIKYILSQTEIKLVKIITIILDGLKINSSSGFDPLMRKIEGLKKDLLDLLEDIKGVIQHIVESLEPLLQMPKINHIIIEDSKQITAIPEKMIDRFKEYKDEIAKILDWESGKMNTQNANQGKILNIFVPVINYINTCFEDITQALSFPDNRSKILNQFSANSFSEPCYEFDKPLLLNDPYGKHITEQLIKTQRENTDNKTSIEPPTVTVLSNIAKKYLEIITSIKSKPEEIKEAQINLGQTLFLPMLQSKIELLGNIFDKLRILNGGNFLTNLKATKLLEPVTNFLSNNGILSLHIDQTVSEIPEKMGLGYALRLLDDKIESLKKIFQKSYYKVDPEFNTLHFIYNSHNITFKEVPKEIKLPFYKITGIHVYKTGKGYIYDEIIQKYTAPKEGVSTADPRPIFEQEAI